MQATKVAKKKDQEKADKAERERARQEAQMAKAMKRARDTETKKASVKATALGNATANGQEPSPKRCEPHEPQRCTGYLYFRVGPYESYIRGCSRI